jgi:hypothetical protein
VSSTAVIVIAESDGDEISDGVTANVPRSAAITAEIIVTTVVAGEPTATESVGVATPGVAVAGGLAACAGTTDKSPNPSEATATADTFFNEIVFTIFLSFSQIKDDLLPGW